MQLSPWWAFVLQTVSPAFALLACIKEEFLVLKKNLSTQIHTADTCFSPFFSSPLLPHTPALIEKKNQLQGSFQIY